MNTRAAAEISMSFQDKVEIQSVLDGLGQGILIFSSEGKLVQENLAARTILGSDLGVLKSEGWAAASVLFNSKQTNPDETIDVVRSKALQSERPVRFHTYRSGEYLPCWASAFQGKDGHIYTMITLDAPDWSAMTALLDQFKGEMREAVQATQGHVDLIKQTMKAAADTKAAEQIARRIGGFTRLVSIHMHRSERLLEMLERLEDIRTGRIRDIVKDGRRKIVLLDYLEDFLEELDEIMLVDPETEATDHRSRISLDIPDNLAVIAPNFYLTQILQDILRNAIMYSMKATPVKIRAQRKNQGVQIDIVDEGYGIREKERDRVFEPFQRARQPQIISEFGYGLSLYLCKHEVEAMNGRLWFDSVEGVGTTMSFILPVYVDEAAAESSSESSQV
jgi:signal transduction histidine kinase